MAAVCRDPVFILTASRSGSTLLRFILDTHPDFACPPETMIAAACVPLLRSWDIMENAASGQQRLVSEPAQLPPEAIELVRDVVDRLYGRYLARRGKPRWCDKSLDSILSAELLAEVYPQARFVCLYRHCMDVIASGAEACPWGVSRFGFDPFVAQNPGNTVAAIGGYWAEWATMMLAFEQSRPDRCIRIRYEDLANAPEEEAARLLTFLGAEPVPGITAACFQTPHEGDGPGDEKIWFTTKVGTETIGRGVKVPADALPGPLREQINTALDQLGYRAVDQDWNNLPGPVDPRSPDTVSPRRTGEEPAAGRERAATPPVVRSLQERIRSNAEADPSRPVTRWPAVAGQTVTLVVADDGRSEQLNWTFPRLPADADDAGHADADDAGRRAGTNGAAAGSGPVATMSDPVATMIAGQAIWQALLDGRANMITEIRHGRLRCINRRDAHRVRSDEVHAVAWLLGLAQVPLAHQAENDPPRSIRHPAGMT
jgi:signal recognition particle subunit SEC65